MTYVLTVVLMLANGELVAWPSVDHASLAACEATRQRVEMQMAEYPTVRVLAMCKREGSA